MWMSMNIMRWETFTKHIASSIFYMFNAVQYLAGNVGNHIGDAVLVKDSASLHLVSDSSVIVFLCLIYV